MHFLSNIFSKFRKKKTLINYGISAGGQAANRALALVISILIARLLGPEDFGAYSLFFAVFILIYQAQTGINIAYVRFAKTQDEHGKLVALKITTLIQGIIALFLIVAGWPLAFFSSKLLALGNPIGLFLGFACGALVCMFQIWQGVYQEKEDFFRLSINSVIYYLTIIILILLLWAFAGRMSVLHIYLIYLLAGGVLGLIGTVLLWRQVGSVLIKRALFRDMFQMTVKNIAVTFSYFLFRSLDVFFIKYYLDLHDVGTYSTAVRTSNLLSILVSAMTLVLLPLAASGGETPASFRKYIVKSYGLAIPVAIAFGIFAMASKPVLNFLYGETYLDAAPVLKVLIFSWGINVLYLPVMQLFYSFNRVGYRLGIELFKILTSLVIFVILIPKIGIMGAAWALLISIILSLILGSLLMGIFIHKRFSIRTIFRSTRV